jgi:hypothetical protein
VFDQIPSCLVRIPFKCERHGVGYTVTSNPILLKRRRRPRVPHFSVYPPIANSIFFQAQPLDNEPSPTDHHFGELSEVGLEVFGSGARTARPPGAGDSSAKGRIRCGERAGDRALAFANFAGFISSSRILFVYGVIGRGDSPNRPRTVAVNRPYQENKPRTRRDRCV